MYVLLPSEIVKIVGCNVLVQALSLVFPMSQVFVQVICPEMGVNRSL